MINTNVFPRELTPSKIYGKKNYEPLKKIGLTISTLGILALVISTFNNSEEYLSTLFISSFGLMVIGAAIYFHFLFHHAPAGIKNNYKFISSFTSAGTLGWILGIFITGFYIILYWFPAYIVNVVKLFDSLSYALRGMPADRWFMYGALYTAAVIFYGITFGIKYRHNRYQLIRTMSVSFFQMAFAFLIPSLLHLLNEPEYYFSYLWPLKYDYLFPSRIDYLMNDKFAFGQFMIYWTLLFSFIGVPLFTYFFGKRWYCSWVCGCGGLAETAGDSFRHLSNKSLSAWKLERWMIHSVLVFVFVTTGLLWLNSFYKGEILGSVSQTFAKTYGFLIGALFSGVVGVGFYPIFGSRVWCRFGCPLAALLGIYQKYFSRFRITTNGGQCISCGNCSTYCEMGIDVRWYAQRGQNIVRSSCVGCGICSAVCPRGVLKLENDSLNTKYN